MSNDADSIERLVQALQKVPAKHLKLIDLANEIPLVNGVFDQNIIRRRQVEIRNAVEEAKMYGAHTASMVSALSLMRGGG